MANACSGRPGTRHRDGWTRAPGWRTTDIVRRRVAR